MFYNIKSYENALRVYEKLYPYLNDQTHFYLEYGQCLSKTSHFEESNNVLHKSALISCDPIIYIVIGKNYQATAKERGKVFAIHSKLISIAAARGADLSQNSALAEAVAKARKDNVPNDNIDRAIKHPGLGCQRRLAGAAL